MRVIVAGLGVQGVKRRAVAGKSVVAVVDPVHAEATHRAVADVPLDSFDAALVCTPDNVKLELLTHLLGAGKHVLVEKPLISANAKDLAKLAGIARAKRVTCYTAYNHRFEPGIARMKREIESGKLGAIYSVRMFYGNGTARQVRDSVWRDAGIGVLHDLGSHLLDMALYFFGELPSRFELYQAKRFENRAYDHVVFGADALPALQMEVSLMSWRNTFTVDVLAERGSVHVNSLCKWGPATFTLRDRKLPSGRPDEENASWAQPDPTWELEYRHFKSLCETGASNIDNDIRINSILNGLA